MLFIAGSTIFFACSDQDNSNSVGDSTGETSNSVEDLTEGDLILADEFNLVYSNPKEYKGRKVEFYGKIFIEPEKDAEGTYLQMYTLNQGSDGNTVVAIQDPNLDVSNGDIVYVKLDDYNEMICDIEDWMRLKDRHWRLDGAGYVVTSIKKKYTSFHRVVMIPEKGKVVDHINHNKLDNRKNNLRVVPFAGRMYFYRVEVR